MNESLEMFYEMIERMKSVGVYEYIGPTINKTVFIYTKRFGNAEYARSVETNELCMQVEDCVNHFIATNKNTELLISKMTKDEHAMFLAVIMQFILEPEN